jgi:hypothetical protein
MYLNVSATRQNLIPNPIDINNWSRPTATTGVSSVSIASPVYSPHGLQGARILGTSSSTGVQGLSTSVTLAPSGYTFAAYIKPILSPFVPLSVVKLELTNLNQTQGASCSYILSSNGSLSANTLIQYGSTINSTATITLSTNGWFYCTLTVNNLTNANLTYYPKILLPRAGNVYVYNTQLELSATYRGHLYGSVVAPMSSQVVGNGEAVGFWKDKTSNNNHFSIGNKLLTTRPTWSSTLSALVFDGTDDGFTSHFDKQYTSQTVFVLTRPNGAATGQRTVYGQRCGETNGFNVAVGASTAGTASTRNFMPLVWEPGMRNYYDPVDTGGRSTTTYRSYISHAHPQNNRFSVFMSQLSGSALALAQNGSHGAYYVVSQSNNTPYTDPAKVFYTLTPLCNFATNETHLNHSSYSGFYQGECCEVIVYDRGLTPTEIEDVNYYLARKWSFLNVPRTVYPTKNGDWSDPTVWSVNLEPAPHNAIKPTDYFYTNNKQVTASDLASIQAAIIGGYSANPLITQGGTFMLNRVGTLRAEVINGNDVSTPTYTVLVSSSQSQPTQLSATNVYLENAIAVASFSTLNVLSSCVISTEGYGLQGARAGTYGCITLLDNSILSADRVGMKGNSKSGSGSRARPALLLNGANSVVNLTNINYTPNGTGRSYSPCIILNNSTATAVMSNCSFDVRNNSNNLVDITESIGVQSANGILYMTKCTLYPSQGTSTGAYKPAVYFAGGTRSYFNDVNMVSYLQTNEKNTSIVPVVWLADTASMEIWLSGDNLMPNVHTPSIFSTSTSTLSVFLTGNILNAQNGMQTICAPSVKYIPIGNPVQYTRHNGADRGSYVYNWTENATFSYPSESDVVKDTLYNNNSLVGTVALPASSNLYFGAIAGPPDKRYYGSTVFDPDTILTVPLTAALHPNSIGQRLINTVTTQTLTALVDSWVFA